MKLHDDVGAICSHTGIDRRIYRTFVRGSEDRVETAALVAPDSDRNDRATPLVDLLSKHEPLRTRSIEREHRWSVMRSILEEPPGELNRESADAGATRLPAGSLSLVSAAGGVGVTTLLAVLGRILSSEHQRVLLVDKAKESLLPFYFGGNAVATGRMSFLPSRDSNEGAVSVLACGLEDATSEESRLWEELCGPATAADRILMDLWQHLTPQGRDFIAAVSTNVIVLIPDVHCAVRVRHFERVFGAARPLYLLNRFDPSVSLHNDLRSWLSSLLGARLLPVAIRRSDEVTLALAEGLTVTDYAPNSAVSNDLYQFAECLRLVKRVAFQSVSNAEASRRTKAAV